MQHNAERVASPKRSSQGVFENNDQWNNYPKHELEVTHPYEHMEYPMRDVKPIKTKKY